MRRAGFRKRQRISRAGPGRVQRDAPDDPVVRVIAIGDVRVEGQDHVGLRGPDLAHELLAQLEAFDELGVRVAEKDHALDAEHVRGQLLLPLADSSDFRARLACVARALVTRGRKHEVDRGAVARHQQHSARAVELDVIGMRDDAERALDAPDPPGR